MQLVRSGYSWSGNERNCVFLNATKNADERSPSFADASVVSGLDFPDDARGLAFVDWDQDGDLDVWLRNRSAPRLRLMRNMTNEIAADNPSVTLQLVGTSANADAIGARAQLFVKGQAPGKRLVRTVRAGDAFLSQSSTQLHFGLANAGETATNLDVEKVIVTWPGGAQEEFSGVTIDKPGQHYTLTQGQGVAQLNPGRGEVRMPNSVLAPLPPTDAARVVLPGRVPFPPVEIVSVSSPADTTSITGSEDNAKLYVLWTSNCPNCREQLVNLTEAAERISAAKLDVVGVCLDGLADTTETLDPDAFLDEIKFPFSRATTSELSMDLVRQFHNSLFEKYPNMVVPMSFLVSAENQLIAIYRGTFSPTTFIRDRELADLSDDDLRKSTAPLPGTWITRPATRAQFAKFVGARLVDRFPAAALVYYETAINLETDQQKQGELKRLANAVRKLIEQRNK